VAGFREFETGEVLTAANVDDFLMKQAVMKFADSAARDTALGTAVGGSNALREGMVAYLDDTDAVQVYDGSSWAAVGSDPNAGIGSNVVQTVKTDTFTTTSATFTPVTDLSVSITPNTATNKVLIVAQIAVGGVSGSSPGHFKVTRGGTDIYRGDAASSRIQAVFGGYSFANNSALLYSFPIVYLDSPATTSSVTYQVETRIGASGTAYVNRDATNADDTNTARGASSITVIEVAA